jgi:outer membrane usher protein
LALAEVRAQTTTPISEDAVSRLPVPISNELFLEVSVNGEASGLILRFTRGNAGLRSTVQNLRDLNLDPALFGLERHEEFDLDGVKGLSYDYDPGLQHIALRISDELRTPVMLNARDVQRPAPAEITPGMVLNYDVYTQLGSARSASLLNELRYFSPRGVWVNNGAWYAGQGQNRYVRFDTYWSYSDPDTLETRQVGDLISSSLSWTRSLRMAGVQWRRSFDLRPDLLTYPVATLNGSAVVPSAVSVYINGVRQAEMAVPPGPFVINQVAGINGAGQATLVTRDAAGRAVSTTLPLYVDTRLLAAGLTDYSVELGALRHNYGRDSFDYARAPAASAALRHGVSDSLTLEAHGEAGRGLVNGGGGVLLALGQAGVVSASLAGSSGRSTDVQGVLPPVDNSGTVTIGTVYTSSGNGGQASLGYQYLSRAFSVDAQRLRATKGYSDLGTASGSLTTLASDRLTLNLALPLGHSLGLSYVSVRAPLTASARIVSASYSAALGPGLYASASAFRDINDPKTRGLFFSLSMTFGDRIAANASRSRQSGVQTTTYGVSRAPDYSGGLGWGLFQADSGNGPLRQAQVQYLGGYGQVSAFAQDNNGKRNGAFDVAGALVLMDGSLQAARQVGAGFALVSTDGVAGVPVLQGNRQIGKTDGGGYLLVPNLNPYLSNPLGIDTSGLPLDAHIATTGLNVVPARLSGVLARFPVEQYAAASVLLQTADGKPVATGTTVLHVESGRRSVVGFDGLAFVEYLKPDNHLLVGEGKARCAVQFSYAQDAQQALPTLGPLICKAVQ